MPEKFGCTKGLTQEIKERLGDLEALDSDDDLVWSDGLGGEQFHVF